MNADPLSGDADMDRTRRGSVLSDLAQGLRFYSRLPVPCLPGEADPHAAPDFARIARVVPLIGAILGGIVALVVLALDLTGLPPAVTALLAVAASVRLTGAFHEDGLADAADGLGGGRTREHKLDIMKDSRIGTYGAAALILALALRVALLAALVEVDQWLAAAALVAAAAVSRTAALGLAVLLPPARSDGAAFAAGRPSIASLAVASALALVIALALTGPFVPLGTGLASLVALAVALYMMRLARRTVGGQTGDIAGATQQVSEIAFLTLVLMFAR
jgi:adenosylcobinamide-GDP ribazoletransferase